MLEEPCQLQSAVELVEPSSEKLVAFGAEGGIEDPLGSRCEGFKDVIDVVHGILRFAPATHCERCWPGPPSAARSRVKGGRRGHSRSP